jgi:hypothetical protein
MRSVRGLLVVAGTFLAIAVLAPWASANSLHPFHLKKECSEFAGTVPSFCTITSANVPAIPSGTKVFYLGPVLGNPTTDPNFISSNAIITDGNGNTASGYCILLASAAGMCAFREGTGMLTGFHASVNVTIDSNGIWHWDGTYLFDRNGH